MKIYIKSHDAIKGLLKKHYRKLNVVVFTDPGYTLPKYIETQSKEFLHIECHDIPKPIKKYIHPTKEMVEKILNWAKDKDNIVCCCHAGISRSSATAYLISAQNDPKTALKVLKAQRHFPNKLIVYHGSKLLNVDVWNEYVVWQKEANGIDIEENDWLSRIDIMLGQLNF